MKAKEVLKFLNISRTTLYYYTRDGIIKTTKLDNGYYDYDEASVFKILKKDSRENVIYARVSTFKQKNSLTNQINDIKDYCNNNNIIIHNIYSEIQSGVDLDRSEFNKLLDNIISLKIKNVYISNKDRLTRLSFKTLEFLFDKFGTKIIIINDKPNDSNDNEIFEELINLMHTFSMTMYSNRRKNKVLLFKNDIENYISND